MDSFAAQVHHKARTNETAPQAHLKVRGSGEAVRSRRGHACTMPSPKTFASSTKAAKSESRPSSTN